MGWTVRGSNPGGGEIFRTRPDRSWGLPCLMYNGYRVFPGGKAARAWCWPPTPSKCRGHEMLELYLYFIFRLLRRVGWYLFTDFSGLNVGPFFKGSVKSKLNSGNVCRHSVQNLLSSSLVSKNIRTKIYRIVMLPGMRVWNWSLLLREVRGAFKF